MNSGLGPTPDDGAEPSGAPSSYCCPGDPTEISPAVHLSRLATFYHKCQICEHRQDLRPAPSLQAQWQQLIDATEPVRLFQTNGIRGRYLNRITRREASQVSAVFAATLREVVDFWRSQRKLSPPGRWLRVAFGHDSRPSSPDLAIAAVEALRQHGCEVWDLGMTLRPQLDRLIRDEAVDGAFLVTGHDSPVGWNGFDLIGPDGVVWSLDGMLDVIERRFHEPYPRPKRESAPIHSVDAIAVAEAQLRQSLHGIRPFAVEIRGTDPVLSEVLRRTVTDWPGTIRLCDQRHPKPPETSNVAPDVVFRVSEDGVAVEVMDSRGEEISANRVLYGIVELLLDEHPHVDLVLSDAMFHQLQWTVQRCGPGYMVAHQGGSSEESLLRTMRSLSAPLATDGRGRYWIRHGSQIVGDALQTIVMVLKSLSRSDRSIDQWGQDSTAEKQ